MQKQIFVEYHNPKDGKTYLVTEKEDRDIKLFSARFLFILSFALILYFTKSIDLIYIVLLSALILVILEFMNFRFRVKLFSVRNPIVSKEIKREIPKYNNIRSIIYVLIGILIIIYTFFQYKFKFELYPVFMYAIGLSFFYQAFKFIKK